MWSVKCAGLKANGGPWRLINLFEFVGKQSHRQSEASFKEGFVYSTTVTLHPTGKCARGHRPRGSVSSAAR